MPMPGPRLFRTLRRLASLALAYALALVGLLGAMGVGVHAAEARHAAQLGVICTIHGMADGEGQSAGSDPTPGKLACVEHCQPGGAKTAALPAILPHPAPAWPRLVAPSPRAEAAPRTGPSPARPPPPRGPPNRPA